MRTGQFKKLIAIPVKKGELKKQNPYDEEYEFEPIEDDVKREETETIGYYAMFETVNGFIKKIYWSKQKMEKHALNYSKGYKAKKGYTFWEKDFDEMGNKTMLRQLLSKWGMLSSEIEEAYQKDMSVIDMNGQYEYVDNISDDELQEQITETQTINLENL